MSFNVGSIRVDQLESARSATIENFREEVFTWRGTVQQPSAFSKGWYPVSSYVREDGWVQKVGSETVSGPSVRMATHFDLDFDLIRDVRSSWGSMKDEFTVHRSRIVAAAFRRLQYNEHMLRLERATLATPLVVEPSLVIATKELWLKAMKEVRRLVRIGPHTYEYMKEHRFSHVAPGKLWIEMSTVEVENLLNHVKIHLDDRIMNGIHGTKVIHPFTVNVGQRSRAPRLEEAVFKSDYTVDIERTRIVLYRGGMSGINAFLTKEESHAIYKNTLESLAQKLGLKDKVWTPIIMGGKYYSQLCELMEQYNFIAADGVNWEANIPSFIDGILAYTYIGRKMLPSGAFDTSLLGSMATMLVASTIRGKIIIITILGDDLGIFVDGELKWIGYRGLMEIDPLDTKYKYSLGYSYYDPRKPHAIGIKLTTDSPEKMIPYEVGDIYDTNFKRKMSDQEIKITACVYKGLFPDGRTIPEVIEKVEPGWDNFPRMIQEKLIYLEAKI